jgi:hypothetical protein
MDAGYQMPDAGLAGIEHPVSGIEHQDGNRPILPFSFSSGHFIAIVPAAASRKLSADGEIRSILHRRFADVCRYHPGRWRSG